MDIFEDNEFENLVEDHHLDEDVNKYLEPQDNDDQNEEKRIVPVKIRVRNPQPKLNPERLRGTRGLSVLPTWFENIQLKGKGHESEDLNAVINRLEQWTHRLFPRYTFDDCIDKLEKLGKKNEIKVMLKRIRMDMDINNCVTQVEDDVVEPSPSQIDIFDQIANTVDIFPVTSTPSVSNTGLTEEQRQRMMRNRMLAEERRQAKIRARQEEEVTFTEKFSSM
ncbi:TIMELESS-interacting protein [Acyrthosiphon pisum]|uniref:TIMELESS-interacting protein n=1 Tax=Acyrthosiphon pisum TaxID=7029 RepID=C4WUC1_ACYPI|nr:TIMELESS-interacting protein [Acyrthosiphon pisum]BAH71491.1 ACYPI008045 [Acyrthosiphon pisum]|eukprot:NP_001155740.1 TIMELESS-interacting protein [Acyrthosiphon pisum]